GADAWPRRAHGRPRPADYSSGDPSRRERAPHPASSRRGAESLRLMSRVDRVLFDHIAIGVPRIADTAPFLAGVLGGVPDSGYPSGPFTWGTYRFDGGGCIELIEPVGPSGFVHRFLGAHAP